MYMYFEVSLLITLCVQNKSPGNEYMDIKFPKCIQNMWTNIYPRIVLLLQQILIGDAILMTSLKVANVP